MKRKLKSSNHDVPSKIVKYNQYNHTLGIKFCELPDEMLGLILDFISSPDDGANLLLTCKYIYHALYSSHDLFIPSRLLRDMNRLMRQVQTPTFTRIIKKEPKKKSTNNEMERKVGKVIGKILEIAKGSEERLEMKKAMEKKIETWNKYLEKTEQKHGKKIANLLETNIFRKYKLISMSEEGLDYRTRFSAEFTVGEVEFNHNCDDDEGCSTSWTIEANCCSSTLVEMTRGKANITTMDLDVVKQALGLDMEEISNELLFETVVTLLPWENCSHYSTMNFI